MVLKEQLKVMNKKKKKISIYTPCYNEQETIEYCYTEIKKIFNEKLKNYDYEHIFGDNFSEDLTLIKLKKIAQQDKNVKIISYSRNFGAFASLYNGIISSTGDSVICIAADLQDPPDTIPKMVEKWEEGFEVVYGKKVKREESFLMQFLRNFYYKLVNKFSYSKIPENVGEFCLIDKKVKEALKLFEDHYPYVRGMIADCGFKKTFVDYIWRKRKFGKSTASAYVLVDNAINGLISASKIPMRICLIIGFAISIISMLYSIYSFSYALLMPKQAAPGISLIITAIFFFFGVVLFFLGFVGEYISAIHFQVRKRPLVVINEKINFE